MHDLKFVSESLADDVNADILTLEEAGNIYNRFHRDNIEETMESYLNFLYDEVFTENGQKCAKDMICKKKEQLDKLNEELKRSSGKEYTEIKTKIDKLTSDLKALDDNVFSDDEED